MVGPVLRAGAYFGLRLGTPHLLERGVIGRVEGSGCLFCGLTPCYLAVPETRSLRTDLGDGAFGW